MRPILRLFLAATLLMLCGATPAPPTQRVLAATPLSRMDLPWWKARHEAKLDELHKGRVDLLLLGDSITQDYELNGPADWQKYVPVWQRFYGDRNAINLGFTGDATSHLLWRIENGEVAGIAPKAAVILIGANNLGRLHWSAADTVTGIDAIIEQLRRRLPHTKLLLLGVLPSDRSAWATETTIAINHTLATRYGHAENVAFLDIGHVFMQGGKLNRDLFADPKMTPPRPSLHPSAQGQALMAEAIEPTLAGLLGDHRHVTAR
jgi:lysophospholipase L1-like esterase